MRRPIRAHVLPQLLAVNADGALGMVRLLPIPVAAVFKKDRHGVFAGRDIDAEGGAATFDEIAKHGRAESGVAGHTVRDLAAPAIALFGVVNRLVGDALPSEHDRLALRAHVE